MDLTNYSKGKRMVREDKIKLIDELKKVVDQANAAIEELKDDVAAIPVVAANPILEGTEPELEGLDIGGTKYAMPSGGGDLYLHIMQIPLNGRGFGKVNFYSTIATAFTATDFKNYLSQINSSRAIPLSSVVGATTAYGSESAGICVSFNKDGNNIEAKIIHPNISDGSFNNYSEVFITLDLSFGSWSDTVTKL